MTCPRCHILQGLAVPESMPLQVNSSGVGMPECGLSALGAHGQLPAHKAALSRHAVVSVQSPLVQRGPRGTHSLTHALTACFTVC